jgi:hypothetical protein
VGSPDQVAVVDPLMMRSKDLGFVGNEYNM